MNSRERFHAVLQFEAPDDVPLPCLFQRFGGETVQHWHREGLRRDAHVIELFQFERMELAPVTFGPLPPLERADIEETEEWQVGVDRAGTTETIQRRDAARERYPLREQGHWSTLRRHLNPESPARYPRFWEDYCRERVDRDYPLGLQFTEPFSTLCEWMGLQRLQMARDTERSWLEEMVSYLTDFTLRTADPAVHALDLDFVLIQAPWAYRAGTFGSVGAFWQLFQSFYHQVVHSLRAAHIPAIIVWAPGQVTDLIPLWLESGITGLGPLDVTAGLDARELRMRYGNALVLIGNLDHQTLCGSWRAIADELTAKVPALLPQGGYFPAVDRPVPADVSQENYEYYLRLLRRVGAAALPR